MKIVSVGIREAKINLSRLLKKVKQGQEVIITDRNKPVGKIIPISLDQLPLSERIKKMEDWKISNRIDYSNIKSLSKEIVEKLSRIRPRTLGQASRISGVTPAAITSIMMYIKANRRNG